MTLLRGQGDEPANPETNISGDWLLIGRIIGAHGIKGSLKVKCAQSDLSVFSNLRTVKLKQPNSLSEHEVLIIQVSNGCLLITLKGLSDRNSAEALIGAEVFAPESETARLLPDQWWARDLIGLQVYTTDGDLIGTICNIISGGNDLLEITPANLDRKETILVPLVAELVPKVDLQAGRVEVTNLPGLLD